MFEDILDRLASMWTGLPLERALDWPYWSESGAAVMVFMAGVIFGALWLRRRGAAPSAEILTAMERVVRGDNSGAFKLLSAATRSPDTPPEVYLALASLLRTMGYPDRSATIHRAILQRADLPKALKARASLGLASDYLTLGRSDEAEAVLAKLPRSLRRQEALLALRRSAALRSEDWKEALEAGHLLAKYEHDHEGVSDIYCHMATAALRRGDDDEAATNYRRALRKDGDNVDARQGLARIYVAQGKTFRGRRHIVRALELNEDLAPRLLPLMHVALGSRDKYRDYLEDLFEEDTASPWVGLELAEIAYGDDELEEALGILASLAETYPRSLDVREAYLNLLIAAADDRTIFNEVDRFMALAGEEVHRFRCTRCQYTSAATFVRCPQCGTGGTVEYLG